MTLVGSFHKTCKMIHLIGIVYHGGNILGEEYNRYGMELVLNNRANIITRHGSKLDREIS